MATPKQTGRQTERLLATNPADIARAAHLLRTGHTVAFPTETVYGLGANALSPQAVEQIFLAKQRPHWDPLIVHIASPTQLPAIALASPTAQRLIEAFWPGPLTLLLPRTPAIPDAVTAGRELVGVRQPNHPVALELLRQAGIPIAAPSANTFSHTSPTTARHVLDDLDGRIDAVLDGGPTTVGLESTVAEPHATGITVYRAGGISIAQLIGLHLGEVSLYDPGSTPGSPASLPSPGLDIRHYAPATPLVLVQVDDAEDPSLSLLKQSAHLQAQGKRIGVMLPDGWAILPGCTIFSWGPWHLPQTLAQRLYSGLRELESRAIDVILAPVPNQRGIAEAIRDRLEKAAKS